MDYLAKNHGNKILYFAILSIVIVIAMVVWFFFIVPSQKISLETNIPSIQGGPRVTLSEEEIIQKKEIMQALATEKIIDLSKDEMQQKKKIMESLVKER